MLEGKRLTGKSCSDCNLSSFFLSAASPLFTMSALNNHAIEPSSSHHETTWIGTHIQAMQGAWSGIQPLLCLLFGILRVCCIERYRFMNIAILYTAYQYPERAASFWSLRIAHNGYLFSQGAVVDLL